MTASAMLILLRPRERSPERARQHVTGVVEIEKNLRRRLYFSQDKQSSSLLYRRQVYSTTCLHMVSPLSIVSLVLKIVTGLLVSDMCQFTKRFARCPSPRLNHTKALLQYVFGFYDATTGPFVFLCDRERDL